MAASLFWFNPSNDIALAQNEPHFTPPRQALLLTRYAAPIMWWLGSADDYVLLPSDLSSAESAAITAWKDNIEQLYGPGPTFISSVNHLPADLTLRPWGWSNYTVATFRNAGVPEAHLGPHIIQLPSIRAISHRRSSIIINTSLQNSIDWAGFCQPLPPVPLEINSEEALNRFLSGNSEEFFAKTPWSSSGRGVFRSYATPTAQSVRRMLGIIHSQGSIIIEPAHTPLLNFALLFHSHTDGVHFSGYSIFQNLHATSYSSNLIDTPRSLRSIITRFIPASLLDAVIAALEATLSSLIGNCYNGPMGIDMMIAQSPAGLPYLVPCIELNLRHTMGTVALALARHPDLCGRQMHMAAGDNNESIFHLVPENPFFSFVI